MTILLWGNADDAVLNAVAAACARDGIEPVTLETNTIEAVTGDVIFGGDWCLPLDSVTGVLMRPIRPLASTAAVQAFQAMTAWTEHTSATVMNPLSAGLSNHSKPYQAQLITTAGFAVPDTIVTTDADDVRAFVELHGNVIYKSVSGVRSIVAALRREDDHRLTDVTACPTQFQQFIPGVDYRVHVVGDEVFTCRIESTAVDYRYASRCGATTSIAEASLPDDVHERCRLLALSLRLPLAGIDLRLDRQGRWWCFEVNTSPGFIWFEQQAGIPISTAVARKLSTPCS